jgi:hypothetical protein
MISVRPWVVEMLRAPQDRQVEVQLLAAQRWQDRGLVGRQGRVAETRMGSGKVLGHEGVSGEVDV